MSLFPEWGLFLPGKKMFDIIGGDMDAKWYETRTRSYFFFYGFWQLNLYLRLAIKQEMKQYYAFCYSLVFYFDV